MSYDAKCYDLAKAFLDDNGTREPSEADYAALAQTIQDAIEYWLAENA